MASRNFQDDFLNGRLKYGQRSIFHIGLNMRYSIRYSRTIIRPNV